MYNKSHINSRQKSLDKYYKHPNICQFCGSIIIVPTGSRVAEIKQKQFCNHSCAAKKNNLNAYRRKRANIKCLKCGCEFHPKMHQQFCSHLCAYEYKKEQYLETTKEEIFQKAKNWQSARSSIQVHARIVFSENKEFICNKCGYTKHVDVAHIKSVSSFPQNAKIKEINHKDNLIGLCPSCHTEYDAKPLIQNIENTMI